MHWKRLKRPGGGAKDAPHFPPLNERADRAPSTRLPHPHNYPDSIFPLTMIPAPGYKVSVCVLPAIRNMEVRGETRGSRTPSRGLARVINSLSVDHEQGAKPNSQITQKFTSIRNILGPSSSFTPQALTISTDSSHVIKGPPLLFVVVVWSLSCVRLFATPWTIQSMGFSRPESCSGQSIPSPGIFPTQGSNPGLPNWMRILYQLNHKASPRDEYTSVKTLFKGGGEGDF